ncbi:hypothetical protein HOK51_04690 [Candidatus Woesearchaeota archaeon]|jgi:hypothetical protein|nr:hypothetical protein [Candidatus Woesearchaeota archaeon]MBT6519122.1 hypothetical protein [Candidatus Woesearchaeota archaeon]
MSTNPKLSKKELKKASKRKQELEKQANYWHNSIPNFDHTIRNSLTRDVQTVLNFEQLKLNKKLYLGINLNNWINILISIFNLVLLAINIYLILT